MTKGAGFLPFCGAKRHWARFSLVTRKRVCVFVCVFVVCLSGRLVRSPGPNHPGRLITWHETPALHTYAVHFVGEWTTRGFTCRWSAVGRCVGTAVYCKRPEGWFTMHKENRYCHLEFLLLNLLVNTLFSTDKATENQILFYIYLCFEATFYRRRWHIFYIWVKFSVGQ